MADPKVFVVGIDGMDPKTTRRMVDEGKLPNIKKMIEMGAARQDLVLLGANPTITPPMWTTLSTGAYPNTHGITCYWNQHPTDLSRFVYAFTSEQVKAEQLWDVLTEAGKKVLCWTWPCSWPPVSRHPNLHIVGGMNPAGPNSLGCDIDKEHITHAAATTTAISKRVKKDLKGGAGCVLETDANEQHDPRSESYVSSFFTEDNPAFICLDHREGEELNETADVISTYDVPLKAAEGWDRPLPDGAKEFRAICEQGVGQMPALLLKNSAGLYDTVEIYYKKRDPEPFVRLKTGDFLPVHVMEVNVQGKKQKGTRSISIMKIDAEAGSYVSISLGDCLDIETDAKTATWFPRSLYQEVVDACGYVPKVYAMGGSYPEMASRRTLPAWWNYGRWQADALLHLIRTQKYDAIFTHIHSIDLVGHTVWRWAKSRPNYGNQDETIYQGFIEEIYLEADEYVGKLMPLIDEGWTLILTSDHGLLCSEEDELPYLGEAFVMNVGVMEELGYVALKKDADGNRTREIDWSKTRAVAPRGNHIYVNLKGRNDQGIVDPADKYELERQIIDDLYSYRLNGKRIVQLAVRNKDAALLGLSGPNSGDIIYFLEEGFNRLHGDALSTTDGYFGTTVSPIFVAAGPGVKNACVTERVIREVDVAPTIAAIMGVRQPAQAEGAPVYQILPAQ
ncbi:MAG: alkaline phosphatase family protein [Gracilibacteraceae bacterium]|jgi:predicted AlkP superfamily phosphohydrolase/phosphomutase|nr:alkaline phosphatase family protein [Gracilibacteraceae bacterium]